MKPPAAFHCLFLSPPPPFLDCVLLPRFLLLDVQACFQLVVRNVDDEVDRGRPVQLQLVESEDMCFSSSAPSALTAHRSSEDDR